MVLATTSLGAIWSSVAPEFGVNSILERFVQLRPKVLLICDSYRASGKEFGVLSKMQDVVSGLKPAGLQATIVIGQLARDRKPRHLLPMMPGVTCIGWPDFLDSSAKTVPFLRVRGNTPVWVLYSSGTSKLGSRKCCATFAYRMLLICSGQTESHHTWSLGHDSSYQARWCTSLCSCAWRRTSTDHYNRLDDVARFFAFWVQVLPRALT